MDPQSRTIAVLAYREPEENEQSYFTLLRRGLEAGARAWGLTLVDGLRPDAEGLAVLGSFDPEEILAQYSGPTVFLNHSQPPLHADSVHIHFEQAVEEVLDYLTGLGHRKIAVVGGVEYLERLKPESARHFRPEPRREFFVKSMKRRGLWAPSLVTDGDWSIRGGYDAVWPLLHSPHRPTAVFAANDPMAVGVLRAARAAGLVVPRDLSIVGFDDLPRSALEEPPLTTIRVHVEQMGRTAAGLLAERLSGRTAALHVQVMTELVVRASTSGPGR